MDKLYLSLGDNEEQYVQLIDYAVKHCDAFLLMEFPRQYQYYLENKDKYQNEIKSFNKVLRKLRPYELYSYFTFGWPGTNEDLGFEDIVRRTVQEHKWSGRMPIKPLTAGGIAHIYSLNDKSAKVLKEETNSFLSWIIPNRLEDLSFFTKVEEDQYGNAFGGELFLFTIAHEGRVCLNIHENSLEDLRRKVPALCIKDEARTLVHTINT